MKVILYWGVAGVISSFLNACSGKQENHGTPDAIGAVSGVSEFIDERYIDEEPLAQLTGLPDRSTRAQSFSIDAAQYVQVYCVGEILFNLSDEDKKYYLNGDNIELYFSLPNSDSQGELIHKAYVFEYKAKEREQGIHFEWKNVNSTRYQAEIMIPWNNLKVTPGNDLRIDFNIAIGDNDDGFIQESKIIWKGMSDNLPEGAGKYGELRLSRSPDNQSLQSVYMTPQVDGSVEALWTNAPSYAIENIMHGFVKDRLDLTATFRSCWDKENIYFLVEVDDSRQKHILPEKKSERNIFVDYGWIENAAGERVWQMHARSSIHAGGAYKNQKEDTLLYLPPGLYSVNYSTDESHSFNDWTDDPPETPFYGIVLYNQVP